MASTFSTLFFLCLHFLHFLFNLPDFNENCFSSFSKCCEWTTMSNHLSFLSPVVYLLKFSKFFSFRCSHNHGLSSGLTTYELNYCNNLTSRFQISNLTFIQSILHIVIRDIFLKKHFLIMWLYIWNTSEWCLDLLIYHGNVYLLLWSLLCPFFYNFLLILFPILSFCLEASLLVYHLVISFSPKNSAQHLPIPEITICDATASSIYVVTAPVKPFCIGMFIEIWFIITKTLNNLKTHQ